MNQLTFVAPAQLPALITASGDRASWRFMEFFTAAIRNPNTRRAYARDVRGFLAWCTDAGIRSIVDVNTMHVAAYIEQLGKAHPAPTVKRHLAAIRHLFDYLATGGILPFNPAAAVRGPKHSVKRGKRPVLAADEARQLLEAIDTATLSGMRDRALIAMMVYSFARVGAATGMRVEDVFTDQRRLWVRLNEKGGKRHEMPCHHTLEAYLHAWLDGSGLNVEPKAPLFEDRRRHNDNRQSYLPGDWNHGLPQERRHAGEGARDGQPCRYAHHPAVRPAGRGCQPRRR